jgi:hypothetical protein
VSKKKKKRNVSRRSVAKMILKFYVRRNSSRTKLMTLSGFDRKKQRVLKRRSRPLDKVPGHLRKPLQKINRCQSSVKNHFQFFPHSQ